MEYLRLTILRVNWLNDKSVPMPSCCLPRCNKYRVAFSANCDITDFSCEIEIHNDAFDAGCSSSEFGPFSILFLTLSFSLSFRLENCLFLVFPLFGRRAEIESSFTYVERAEGGRVATRPKTKEQTFEILIRMGCKGTKQWVTISW